MGRPVTKPLLLILALQVLTFIALGILFMREGQWRLGIAQALLAAVQLIIYTGRMAP